MPSRKSESKPGDYCREHRDTDDNKNERKILGCSGRGRPSCKAPECLYGAEPCPEGNHFKPEGAPCNFVHLHGNSISIETEADRLLKRLDSYLCPCGSGGAIACDDDCPGDTTSDVIKDALRWLLSREKARLAG